MRSARSAMRTRPPRMTRGARGASRAALVSTRSQPGAARPTASRGSAGMVAIVTSLVSRWPGSPREPDSGVDECVEDIHDQVDPDDHEAGHDHDALDQREVALEDALVEQTADAGPG